MRSVLIITDSDVYNDSLSGVAIDQHSVHNDKMSITCHISSSVDVKSCPDSLLKIEDNKKLLN